VATIVLSSFVVRHPVGGVLANNLQWLTGFQRLGHDVYLVEKAGYDDSCFDPDRRISSDDPSSGVRRVGELLDQHGLAHRWCYVDARGTYHGLDRSTVESVIAGADVFIDRGFHRSWDDEAADVPCRVLLDPDPGFRQVKLAQTGALQRARPYDAYYTYGHNIGTARSRVPTAGVGWRHVFHPVDTALYRPSIPHAAAPCTTVMNWQPLERVELDDRTYGMKDVQFPQFEELPRRVGVPMLVAVEGRDVPRERLRAFGWHVVSALDASSSYTAYLRFVQASLAEFSVVKDVYCGLEVGWFSDRSALYLAHGRPVVVQRNGLEGHLPLGAGLFEVADVDEAADAIARITRDRARHAAAARAIAERYLDTTVVLRRFLDELGVTSPVFAGSRGAS
jgi:hypothetical protein